MIRSRRRLSLLSAFVSALAALASAEMTEEPFMDWETDAAKEPLRVQPGADVELKCGATGSPPPTIHWYKDGAAINTNPAAMDEASVGTEVEQVANQGLPTIQTATTFAKVALPCVDAASAGTYTCVAANGVAPLMSRNTTINVAAGDADCPKVRRSRSLGAEPAKIQMWTDMRLERTDAVAQLFCRATGSPKPAVTWFLLDDDENRTPVLPSHSFIFLRNGDLMVRDPKPRDQGGFNFLCEARNRYGVDSKTITLVDVDFDAEGGDYEDYEELEKALEE